MVIEKAESIDIVYVEPDDYFPKEIREEFFLETVDDDN